MNICLCEHLAPLYQAEMRFGNEPMWVIRCQPPRAPLTVVFRNHMGEIPPLTGIEVSECNDYQVSPERHYRCVTCGHTLICPADPFPQAWYWQEDTVKTDPRVVATMDSVQMEVDIPDGWYMPTDRFCEPIDRRSSVSHSTYGHFVDEHGFRFGINYNSRESFGILLANPLLYFDIYEVGLCPRKTRFDSYYLHYEIRYNRLYLAAVSGEFQEPLLEKFPTLLGREIESVMESFPGCSNPHLYAYTHLQHPVDYTGTITMVRDFDMRFAPKDDKATPWPFREDVYKMVKRVWFEHGVIVRAEMVKPDRRSAERETTALDVASNDAPVAPEVSLSDEISTDTDSRKSRWHFFGKHR